MRDEETCRLNTNNTVNELKSATHVMKTNKASGLYCIQIDGLNTKQITNFGPKTIEYQIPKVWQQAKVFALLKSGKGAFYLEGYRPIFLLCQLFKILERMILNIISLDMDEKIIK